MPTSKPTTRAHLNVPLPKGWLAKLDREVAAKKKAKEAEQGKFKEMSKARMDYRKDEELPPEFHDDPDPRHRERWFGSAGPLVSFTDMVEAAKGLTSPLEKRCIAGVIAKSPKGLDDREKLSRAYAICRSSLQRSGRIKKGGTELTKVGKKRQSQRVKAGQHKQKMSKWKAAVVAARKK